MKVDLKQSNAEEILESFESLHVEINETLEIEVLQSTLESIGYKAFVDLAQIYFMKMLTPKVNEQNITLRFKKLNTEASFHNTDYGNEKYGVESEFFNIDKTKQFSFLYYYQEALKFIQVSKKQRILNLGVNRGDEFSVIKNMLDTESFKALEFLGVDYSQTAIDYAKNEFKEHSNVEFTCRDINELESSNIGRFDLIISIGTLQSSNINFNKTFMSIYQNHLQKGGAMVLGFPNCRWIDGEMIYGAKAPNYSFNEMSLVLKDIHFCKKYLQQKGYRVVITGKDYLFLTARKILK
ncbi:class I SAM-dependent methyltransferase [Sulfurimonas sp.]|nr:class I SAM-dependent methyltransferase [Sulfurimonas sp.]